MEMLRVRCRRQRHRPSRQIARHLDRRSDAGVDSRRLSGNGSHESRPTQAPPRKQYSPASRLSRSLKGGATARKASARSAPTITRTQPGKSSSRSFATSLRISSNVGSLTANESGTWRALSDYPYRLPDLLCKSSFRLDRRGGTGRRDSARHRPNGHLQPRRGTGKWLPAVSQYLRGQRVYLVRRQRRAWKETRALDSRVAQGPRGIGPLDRTSR